MINAMEIYAANLQAVSDGVLTGDFRPILQHTAVPILLQTASREVIVSSVEELVIVIGEARQQLLDKGMVDYRRVCLWAEAPPTLPDMIIGAHRTEIRNAHGFVVPPYHCELALMRIDRQWQAICARASVEEEDVELLSPDIAVSQQRAHAAREARARAMDGPSAR